MDIRKLSKKYFIRRLCDEDVKEVFDIAQGNPLYYEHCPPAPSVENILRDMKALPPRTLLENKYYVGYFEEEKLIAVMDLILGYPDSQTVFLGFFMLSAEKQGNEVGTHIISEAMNFFSEEGYRTVRLAYAKMNPQARHFWEKNGFSPTGIETVWGESTVVVMEHDL